MVAATLVANLGILNTGMMIGFPSVLLPPLLKVGPGLHISFDQATWLSSISFISAPVGCVVAGPMIDRVGRRRGLVLLNLTFIAGWLPSAVFPLSLPALYVGRICSGIGAGAAPSACSIYTAEVAAVYLRTALVLITPLMLSVGAVITYLWAMLYQESWSEVSWFGLSVTSMSLVLTLLLPESPMWLLNRGHAEKALQALQRLRGASGPEQVKEELDSFSSRASDKQQKTSWLSNFKHLRKPQVYKPLIMINALYLCGNFSGVMPVMSFAVDFTNRAGIQGEAHYVAMCIAIVRMVSILIFTWVSNVFGSRNPAVFFGVIMTASMTMLTVNVSGLLVLPQWLIGALVLVYVYAGSTSFTNIMLSMLGEVFPTEVRGFASGITTGLGFTTSFVATKLYPIFVTEFEAYFVFLFFTIFGAAGTLYIYFFLPETHGKTLLEIEDHFKGVQTTGTKL
ncbi:facilitated trehalose transporter Tret1-like isoform X2 [Homalodisca vitripennis]|uniref:facilitated trehalose transporter Tret1-like isoform X2 n=1 Tax=Homalodisca vitripennis TaxID=197043 RepID=UPI001EEAE275|nr:facilitated trehalose transporter Tret1-like isoform X2 [Homalodisca vitripennis]